MTARARSLTIPPGGFEHIAVIRLSSLGDVILAESVVRALHTAYPAARITFWTREEYRDVVRFNPAIFHVRALEADARKIEDLVSMSAELEDCDLIVDLHGNAASRVLTFRQSAPTLRSASYRLRRMRWVHARWTRPQPAPPALVRYASALAPLGLGAADPPRLEAGGEAEEWAAAEWAEWGPARVIAVCPGARHFTKRWPERHWIECVASLRERGDAVLMLGLESERRALAEFEARFVGDANVRWCVGPLPRMAALLSRCAAAISGDSGLMHVAAARGIGVVALFGSTVPELGFAPAGPGHEVLCRREPCQPCTLHGRPACPRGHFRCLMELRPAGVVTALDRLIERESQAYIGAERPIDRRETGSLGLPVS